MKLQVLCTLWLLCLCAIYADEAFVRLVGRGFVGTNFTLVQGEALHVRAVLFNVRDRQPRIEVTYPEVANSLPVWTGDMISGPARISVQGYNDQQTVVAECVWYHKSGFPPLVVPKVLRLERSEDLTLWEPVSVIRDPSPSGFWRITWE